MTMSNILIKRQYFVILLLFFSFLVTPLFAGDDASGPDNFNIDLSEPYQLHNMTLADQLFIHSLIKNLKYTGQVIHFLKTDLKISINQVLHDGEVYQALEKPEYFYIVASDAMLKLGYSHPYSPGVNGFSMHRSKSKNVIACLNFQIGGVPFYSGTKVIKGNIHWKGHLWSRFEEEK